MQINSCSAVTSAAGAPNPIKDLTEATKQKVLAAYKALSSEQIHAKELKMGRLPIGVYYSHPFVVEQGGSVSFGRTVTVQLPAGAVSPANTDRDPNAAKIFYVIEGSSTNHKTSSFYGPFDLK